MHKVTKIRAKQVNEKKKKSGIKAAMSISYVSLLFLALTFYTLNLKCMMSPSCTT